MRRMILCALSNASIALFPAPFAPILYVIIDMMHALHMAAIANRTNCHMERTDHNCVLFSILCLPLPAASNNSVEESMSSTVCHLRILVSEIGKSMNT